MNVPSMTATAAAVVIAYHWMRPTTPKEVVQSSLMPCQAKYCNGPTQIWVDSPMHTLLRDDTLGGASLKGAQRYVHNQYVREAEEHPGVHLVSHSVP